MRLPSDEVRNFMDVAERILSPPLMTRPLTREDAVEIERRCLALLAKVRPLLQEPD